MLADERKAFVRRQIEELWNKGNLDAADECYTSDYVSHDPASPEEIRGPVGFKQNVAAVRAAFPDFHMQIVDQVAEGDRVVTRYVTTGTQEGELTGIPRPAGGLRLLGWASTTSREARSRSRGSTTTC
jgi:predicted ester cyclase